MGGEKVSEEEEKDEEKRKKNRSKNARRIQTASNWCAS
jgi:hypothetical protein